MMHVEKQLVELTLTCIIVGAARTTVPSTLPFLLGQRLRSSCAHNEKRQALPFLQGQREHESHNGGMGHQAASLPSAAACSDTHVLW